ncbi:cupin-like domain-containing protein [Pseudoalteromonas piscicida]|uniref:cupin-like domain-containing protein n=1 Tax=Pseudoalteromonas piscicida TaxID=43662 RepID=UPI0030A82BA3
MILDVPIRSEVDVATEFESLGASSKPFVIKSGVPECKALTHWDIDYFEKTVDPALKVKVKRPKTELPNEYEYVDTGFGDLLTDWKTNPNSQQYLAGCGRQVASLQDEVKVPSFIKDTKYPIFSQLWIGINGFTPFHFHPGKHAFVCQLVGKKRFILAAPQDTKHIYPYPWYSNFLNTSRIQDENLAEVNLNRFPKWKNITLYDITLQPGDLLYIPPQWWHCVSINGFSAMCSYFWLGRLNSWMKSENSLRTLRAVWREHPWYVKSELKGLFGLKES